MKSFRFPLQKPLEWRQVQLQLEESRMKQLTAGLRRLDAARAELEAALNRAEREVIQAGSVDGTETAALDGYRSHARKSAVALLRSRREQEQRIAVQHRNLLEARRRVRILEKFRDRQLAEWKSELNREVENFASEAYLAQWNRRARRS